MCLLSKTIERAIGTESAAPEESSVSGKARTSKLGKRGRAARTEFEEEGKDKGKDENEDKDKDKEKEGKGKRKSKRCVSDVITANCRNHKLTRVT